MCQSPVRDDSARAVKSQGWGDNRDDTHRLSPPRWSWGGLDNEVYLESSFYETEDNSVEALLLETEWRRDEGGGWTSDDGALTG